MDTTKAVFRKLMNVPETFNKGDILKDQHGKSKITSINKVTVQPNGLVEVIGWCKRIEEK